MKLDSGQTISLLGLQITPQQKMEARAYLQRFVRGKKVLVRRDANLTETKAVYLLLSNKLFINRKMIEMGLALADASVSHQYQAKFLAAEFNAARSVKGQEASEPGFNASYSGISSF